MQFPCDFEERMKRMLGEEYEHFASAFDEIPVQTGIRINTLRKNAREIVFEYTGELEKVPWCENGYYIDKTKLSGKHPYHVSGLVYFQEPSAMSTASALDIEPGDYVLDLCAAPGGKATQAAEKLQGKGLLVANEIVPKRARILAENIGRMGIKNAVVTNESPERLAKKYPEFFDKIIVDAPCSGEGMFRKEPQAVEEWSIEHTKSCAVRQKNILESAVKMLKGGGYLIYSTCTFAPEENEGIAVWLAENHPEMELVPIVLEGMDSGRSRWADTSLDLSGTKRIFPHKSKGEGHFVAMFVKRTGGENACKKTYKCENAGLFYDFAEENLVNVPEGVIIGFGDRLYMLPESLDIDKIKVESAGLFLGTCKKNRFEPSHDLCLALEREDFKNTLETDTPEVYFRGETLTCASKGWTAVLYKGCPVGWGKASEGVLKNHFPKHLRF